MCVIYMVDQMYRSSFIQTLTSGVTESLWGGGGADLRLGVLEDGMAIIPPPPHHICCAQSKVKWGPVVWMGGPDPPPPHSYATVFD